MFNIMSRRYVMSCHVVPCRIVSDLVLINRAGGLYLRISIEVVSTDPAQ